MTETPQSASAQASDGSDRTPDLADALAAVQGAEDFPTGPVRRLEVTCLANGEVTWRVQPLESDELLGGFFATV